MNAKIINNIDVNKKVAVIGAGFVGSSIAYAITLRNVADEVVLIDIDKKKTTGEALDIEHGISLFGTCSIHAGDYADCSDCDLIIITAGRNRRPGETRLDLIRDNTSILKQVVDNIKPYYSNSTIMLVANPVDMLVYYCTKWMGLPDGKVFGTGCILDTSRLLRETADFLGLRTDNIKGYIAGEHGDGQIPIWSRFSVAGIPLDTYCAETNLIFTDEKKAEISAHVRQLGAEIIADKGKTHYGIATCSCYLANAVLNQQPTIASVSTVLNGEYGVSGVALSVPSIVGVSGVEKRFEEPWNDSEKSLFIKSAENIKTIISGLNI